MIGYVTLGTNDIDKARNFYDQVLAEIGLSQMMKVDDDRGFTMYGDGKPVLAITRPHDGKPASVGNGSMLALSLDSQEKVDRVHARALALGGADEGAPGFRPQGATSGFYGAYFRDPDGNKICAYNYNFGG
jgi:catechol 2,3-dioxygenase-like lactoylglutathione lyase family enzyme